jgi:ketosteroid isomerase-like protein
VPATADPHAGCESVELVRRAVEAFNRAVEGRRPEPWLTLYDVGFEGEELEGSARLRHVRGHPGLRAWFARTLERFEAPRVEVQEAVSTGPDEVITTERWIAPATAGRSGLDARVFCVNTARQGRIASRHVFATREEAVAAAVGERAPGAIGYD